MSLTVSLMAGVFLSHLSASTLVATDVIRAGERVTHSNAETEAESLSPEDEGIMGMEVRRTVYAGQAIKESNIQKPRLVKRNQIVTVKYLKNSLEITISGRAMGAAAAGETVSVMNLKSRNMVTGTVTAEGWILAQ